jgi:hypothetical protein
VWNPLGNSSIEFAAMISADIKLWAKTTRIAGIKAGPLVRAIR